MANSFAGFPGTENAGRKGGGDTRGAEQTAWTLQSKGKGIM